PPPVKIAPVTADLEINGLDTDGGITEATSITVEEVRTVERYPLLTYVFFSNGDADTPLRQNLLTKEQAAAFTIDDAKGQELEIYRNMLNVIGRRLKDTPTARITLTGTNADVGDEKGATALSRRRAETVKTYFTDVWGIESRRIDVKARNLPVDPSAVDDERGQEENRRVEITSNNESIIGPIRRDELEYNASLAGLVFEPKLQAPNGIERWSLAVKQGEQVLFSKESTGTPPDPVYSWDFSGDVFARTNDPLQVTLFVRDRKKQEANARKTVAMNTLTLERKREERIGDVRINRSKLILFDFDKATVSARNRSIIEEVSESITPNSRVSIVGYTDAMGDAEYNVRLSQQRAEAVRRAFGNTLNNVAVTTQGVGSTQLLFSNDTPAGRFYCRMVQVIIETPVSE
ncbi:MAG: OmpA family protein, partial [Bacteroidetes bacterium]|nr:OmpA family protein [Bacteroidota bacterium]